MIERFKNWRVVLMKPLGGGDVAPERTSRLNSVLRMLINDAMYYQKDKFLCGKIASS